MPQQTLPLSAADGLERRRLAAFILASLALHAAVIITLPNFSLDALTSRPSVLEVTLLRPQPLPAAAEPEPQLPNQQVRPEQVAAADVSRRERNEPAQAPALALSQPDPAESSFRVAPPRLPESLPAPDLKIQAANAVVTPARFDASYLSNPAPAYPPAARRAGAQGTVTLRVLVMRDGLPSRVEIEKSSGSRLLDIAARDAVWGWRFTPALQGTDPIESWMLVPVAFRLD